MQTRSPLHVRRGAAPPPDTAVGPHRAAEPRQASLRTDLDRALARAAALLCPLMLLQSIPSFLAQRAPGAALAPLSLVLAALPCLFVVAALASGSRASARRWLLFASGAYLVVIALEGFEARESLSIAYMPWLLVVAPVFIPCVALGVRRTGSWIAGTLLAAAGMVVVYLPRLPFDRMAMSTFGVVAFSAAAFFGVRALRRRAYRAEAAQAAARTRYDVSQRRIALEEERTRTDALLHDSLLNALLVAAAATGAQARADAARDAALAIEVLHGSERVPVPSTGGEDVAEVLRRELAPVRASVRLDLDAAHDVRLPQRVTESLIAAALQAVNNSIKHAGPGADRLVRAEPDGVGGVRVVVQDDGRGFDLGSVAAERLGVRVSIIGRMQAVGGTARIESAPEEGALVALAWTPAHDDADVAGAAEPALVRA